MCRPGWRSAIVLLILCSAATCQVLTIPGSANRFGNAFSLDAIQAAQMDFNFFTINSKSENLSPLQTPSGSVSNLDLKAPGKAQREYKKGYLLLMRNDPKAAIEHLSRAIAVYQKYVAAHNAMGSAYLNLQQNDEAKDQFSEAVSLDDHMPNSYLNLGCAQLALKQYADAEETFRKASSLAPLDTQLQLALAYAEFSNKDYPAVIATTREVHGQKHEGASLVHFFAAASLEAQNNLSAAQDEINILLKEDPKSPFTEEFRRILAELRTEERKRAELKFDPVQKVTYSIGIPNGTSPEVANRGALRAAQNLQQSEEIEEAEKEPAGVCTDCGLAVGENASSGLGNHSRDSNPRDSNRTIIRASVDEVSVMFAATDRGKSVKDLASSDVQVLDNSLPPKSILHFRNEAQLPLRLGLVIDTSDSVTERFKFEQAAAIKFLQKVVTGSSDLAFVVGVNNSVLLVQDFTSDQERMDHAIAALAPTGGTALWDAVNFATEKLASRPETEPVARVMVVISDGEDNSSSVTLKDVIAGGLRREVAVYTVSTRESGNTDEAAELGDRALQTISQLTGGGAYRPGSVGGLNGSLSELQEVIHGRYLISYRPASFQRDGHYRAIDISAEKSGRKLRVYARRGYYASGLQAQQAGTSQ